MRKNQYGKDIFFKSSKIVVQGDIRHSHRTGDHEWTDAPWDSSYGKRLSTKEEWITEKTLKKCLCGAVMVVMEERHV